MTRATWAVILCALALISANVALAVPTEQASLNNCQNAVKTAAAKYVSGKAGAIDGCLQAISSQLIKNNAADVSKAAATCVAQFRLLNDSRGAGRSLPEKLAASINKACNPGGSNTHTLNDILGPSATVTQPINASNVGAWCAQFGGTGTITTLNGWISCIQQSQECAVDTAVSTQYPRALEWLGLVETKMLLLSPPSTDPDKISDAVDALENVRQSIAGPGGLAAPNMQCGRKDFVATGQTTSYAAGDDGAVRAGAALRYHDNDDGTITDLNTGLMWEKKIQLDGTKNAANLNDADNCYPWAGSCQTGGAFCGTDGDCGGNAPCNATDCQGGNLTIFKWVAALNAENSGAGFAEHNDWRVPNVKELQSIADYGNLSPAVDVAFNGASCGASCADLTDPACSCTQSNFYWSATTVAGGPNGAWLVDFNVGYVGDDFKSDGYYVRAVRSGL